MSIIGKKRNFLTGTTLALLVTCFAGGITPSFGSEKEEKKSENIIKNDIEIIENDEKNLENQIILINDENLDDSKKIIEIKNKVLIKNQEYNWDNVWERIGEAISQDMKIEKLLKKGSLKADSYYELFENTFLDNSFKFGENEKKGQQTLKKIFVLKALELIINDRQKVVNDRENKKELEKQQEEKEMIEYNKDSFLMYHLKFKLTRNVFHNIGCGLSFTIKSILPVEETNHTSLLKGIIAFSLKNELNLSDELFEERDIGTKTNIIKSAEPYIETLLTFLNPNLVLAKKSYEMVNGEIISEKSDMEKKTVQNDRDTFIEKFNNLDSGVLEGACDALKVLAKKYVINLSKEMDKKIEQKKEEKKLENKKD